MVRIQRFDIARLIFEDLSDFQTSRSKHLHISATHLVIVWVLQLEDASRVEEHRGSLAISHPRTVGFFANRGTT
jgi:hypothetical protein